MEWKLHHAAFVVKDMEKAVEFYTAIGWIPMKPPVTISWGGKPKNSWIVEIYGKPMDPEMHYRFCLLKKGDLIIELFQTVGEVGYLWNEFLNEHGEGIQHLHFDVENLEKEVTELVKKGFPLIFAVRRPDGSLREAFLDTRKIGGVIIALYQEDGMERFPGLFGPGENP